MNRNTSLVGRMTRCFAVIVIVVVAILGVLNMAFYNRGLSDSLMNTFEAVAQNNADGISLMVTHTDMLCRTLTDSRLQGSSNAYISYLLTDDVNLISSFKRFQELKNMLLKDCRMAIGSIFSEWSVNLFLTEEMPLYAESFMTRLSLETLLNTHSGNENLQILRNSLVREDDWYQKALEADGTQYWFEKDGFLCAARSVTALNQGNAYGNIRYHQMGVVLLIVRAESVSRFVSGQLTENSCARLCSADGAVLWRSQPHIPPNALEITREIDGGLKLSMYVPYRDIHQMTDHTLSTLCLFLLLCAGVGGLLVLMVSGWITRPVRQLSAFMKEKKGELLPEEMIPRQKDEIRALYASYNELIHAIRAEEEKRRRAEMDSLQLQINPHFLYNTLDSVCFQAMTAGQNEIADILSTLAGIYRYNVKNSDGEVTLGEELAILTQYMDIYRFRSSDGIRCRIDVEESLREAVIPKMILQPLVENAILYGSGDSSGEIRISCVRDGENLRLCVTDAGTQADTDRINAYLQGKDELSVHSTGIGIRNVHQRIRMRYGAPYGLTYRKTARGNTCAELLLPWRHL